MKKTIAILILLLLSNYLLGQNRVLTGIEIMQKIDENEFYKTIQYTGKMTIHIDDQIRTKELCAQAKSKGHKALVEFINPEDYGTKYLMLDDELWIYFPSEEEVVKISGHMLKEGMMGSDFSYEDALEANKISEKYDVQITGQDTLNGNPCWVLTLEAKVKDVPYYSRKMWVDKERYIPWKEEMYAKSGRLLKEMNVLQIRKFGERIFPVKSEMVNKLRRNSKTVFELEDIAFDIDLPDDMFSLRYLQR
ncbi:MAG TPA: outer membrane lipoprotein-sorting protein [Candidatus Cloacimonetes bacterium]|nr:outer membrane lipoprotein-sorting protein [Candidatus Cloacimonadota bacterium]HEX37468.1 outer membrane lipoprotein-sorting protein [Candidatus Cloacimonadota bacterium]